MRKWKRVMACGCTHGDLVHPAIRKQVLQFKEKFKPEIRFDLGDLIDTACFRTGAAGTADECKSPRDDHAAAIRWLKQYAPTHLAWGNHDWRLYLLQSHPKAIVSTLAGDMWNSLQREVKALNAKTVPYDIQKGWFEFGGCAWGHGYMYGMNALRDHSEMTGLPTIMAHLHYPHQIDGRTLKPTQSFCVGALADDEKLEYGRRRRQSLVHGHGLVYGETNGKETHLWLIKSPNGKSLHFPPNIL